MNPKHYSLLIQWDPRDDIYVVTVPELYGCRTHGNTYEEAIKNALEVIEMWIEDAQKTGESIPPPIVAASIKIQQPSTAKKLFSLQSQRILLTNLL